MSGRPFHLGWFVSRGYGPKAWRRPWAGPRSAFINWQLPETIVELARAMERSAFDYIMLEDSSNVPYTYGGSHDPYLRYAVDCPKLDPAVLVPYIAQATSRLGIVVTASTTEYPPFLLARLLNTLDHVTLGRVGWNAVTGSNDGGAQNYGLERQYEHDHRYDMADEYVELLVKLWESWDREAIVMDVENDLFADPEKVSPIFFEGKFYKSRGPLSAPQSPQGRPVICQAGGSPRGRNFAARWADTIITSAPSVQAMKQTYAEVRAKVAEHGRNPDDVKQLFLVSPVVGETDEEARAKKESELADSLGRLTVGLASASRVSGIDLSQYGLDEVITEVHSNGHRSLAEMFVGRTPRQIATRSFQGFDLTGTIDHVASVMEAAMEEVGGDGFLIANSHFTRRYVVEITDGLVPELQRRGLVRESYAHELLRDNLLEF